METEGVLMMNIPDEVMDQAYTVYEEWGPNRRKDRVERLKEEFPALTEAELDFVVKEMKAVNATVWKIAEKGGEMKNGKDGVVKMLQKKHPFLKWKGLIHAFTLVNYYAWHEGYDK
jgi:hypothetical protein